MNSLSKKSLAIAFATFAMACASVAHATPMSVLGGELDGGGHATISGNTFTPSPSTGAILSTDGGFDAFSSGTLTFYTVDLANASTGNPLEFLSVTEGGQTIAFYITSYSTYASGATGVKGTFLAGGYVTDTADPGSKYPVPLDANEDFSLTADATGSGNKAFSFSLVVPTPEPNSLMLLGTGLLGFAFVVGRKTFVKG